MSHFSVLVITDGKPENGELEAALAPYHEFECTGHDDQYVQDLDVTEDMRKEFEAHTTTKYRAPDGSLYDSSDDRFYREPTPEEEEKLGTIPGSFGVCEGLSFRSKDWDDGRGYRAKIHYLPEGFQEVKLKGSEVMPFRDYVEGYEGTTVVPYGEEPDTSSDHKYGYALLNEKGEIEKVVRRTNVDKWVWMDAEGNEVGRTIGDEALPDLQQGPSGGGVLQGQGEPIKPEGSVHVLQDLHAETQPQSNDGSTLPLARESEVPAERTGAQHHGCEAERQVSDLQDASGHDAEERSPRGPLPLNGDRSRHSVRELQQADRLCEGQSGDPSTGHRVSGPLRKVLVSGAKWDWWQIGGRWSGHFKPNYDPNEDPANKETCWLCQGTGKRSDMECENGCNGCQGTGISTKWPTQWRTDGNQIRFGDLPLEELRTAAEQAAAKAWDKFNEACAGRPYPDWQELVNQHGIENARKIYNADPVVLDCRKTEVMGFFETPEKFLRPRAEARDQAIQTFAVLKDGQWYERGEMGWWACVSNDKGSEWTGQFSALLDGLTPDHWLTVVDCHI